MNLNDLKVLYDYDRWAQDRVLGVVATITKEQYEKNLGSSHGGIRGTLVHSYAAYEIWYARWRGESPTSLTSEEMLPTFTVLREKTNDLLAAIRSYVEALTEGALQAPLAYRDTKGNPSSTPLWQQMQHLVNHSTYHRGQAVAMLRQLGVKPVSTDLINYYRLQSK